MFGKFIRIRHALRSLSQLTPFLVFVSAQNYYRREQHPLELTIVYCGQIFTQKFTFGKKKLRYRKTLTTRVLFHDRRAEMPTHRRQNEGLGIPDLDGQIRIIRICDAKATLPSSISIWAFGPTRPTRHWSAGNFPTIYKTSLRRNR
ncbi:hypothetical protein QTP88_021391 [Uroleucon formosanum]